MAARVHRSLKVIAFNENGIWMRLYKLSKQLQDLHLMRCSSFQIIPFIGLTASSEENAFPITM
jgi:hypothetical protein